MNYKEIAFTISPFSEDNAEWVIAEIESLGFDSFSIEEPVLKAYIPSSLYDTKALEAVLEVFKGILELEVACSDVPDRNWNEIWESQFPPIVVDGRCTVKATFHKDLPDTQYNILIDPKMAFGTGHHQTTYLMISYLMEIDPRGARVLDMGCGTAILAILAAKMGAASPVRAIDIDEVAARSAVENAALNGVEGSIAVNCSDASILPSLDEQYDIVLANINRNILMNDIPAYFEKMSYCAQLVVSGFYVEDVPMVAAVARRCGMEYVSEKHRDDWAAVCFVRRK